MTYCQVVIGPPGSGKSTYCHAMYQFMKAIGRDVAVINLDPANDALPYECAVDVMDLITLTDVMAEFDLGPNGGLIYCMEYLEKNLDWLKERLVPLEKKYLLFDFPGQVELFTQNQACRNLLQQFQKWKYQPAAVHLVDAHHCSDPAKFISVLLLSLSAMCHLELPHVNILSKVDLIEQYGSLAFGLDFYTDVLDLDYLAEHLDNDPFAKRFTKLNKALCSLVEDYNLVNFVPLSVLDKESMLKVLRSVDKANGFIFGDLDRLSPADKKSLFEVTSSDAEFAYEKNASVQERWMHSTLEHDDDDDVDDDNDDNDNSNSSGNSGATRPDTAAIAAESKATIANLTDSKTAVVVTKKRTVPSSSSSASSTSTAAAAAATAVPAVDTRTTEQRQADAVRKLLENAAKLQASRARTNTNTTGAAAASTSSSSSSSYGVPTTGSGTQLQRHLQLQRTTALLSGDLAQVAAEPVRGTPIPASIAYVEPSPPSTGSGSGST